METPETDTHEGYFYQPRSPIPGNAQVWWPLGSALQMDDYRLRSGPYVIAYGVFRPVGSHWEPVTS